MIFRTVGAGKDYATIQAAVDAAADGDCVVVFPGTYVESVVIAKFVHLKGARESAAVTPADIVIHRDGAKPLLIQAFTSAETGPIVVEDLTLSCTGSNQIAIDARAMPSDRTLLISRSVVYASESYAVYMEWRQAELRNVHLRRGYAHFAGRSAVSTAEKCTFESDSGAMDFYQEGAFSVFDAEHVSIGTEGYGVGFGDEVIDASSVYSFLEVALRSGGVTLGADPSIESAAIRLALEPKTAVRMARDIREALRRAFAILLRGDDGLDMRVHRLSAVETRRVSSIHLLADATARVLVEKISEEVRAAGQGVAAALARGNFSAALRSGADRLSAEAVGHSVAESVTRLIAAGHSATAGLTRGDLAATLRPLLSRLAAEATAVGRVDDIRAIVADMHPAVEKISAEVLAAVSARLSAIDERDIYAAVQAIHAPLTAPAVRRPADRIPAPETLSPSEVAAGRRYALWLDGMPVLGRVTGLRLSQDETQVHDELIVESSDMSLWADADPAIHRGQPRLELHVGSRTIQFVLDDRELTGERDFRLSALSLGVRNEPRYLDEPWAPPSTTDYPMAKDLAAAMLPATALVWDLPVDWRVSPDFAWKESPLDSLVEMVAAVGAVVRSDDDGRIVVRRRWPVRPVHMPDRVPDVRLDRTWIVDAGVPQIERTPGYDCIEISGVDTSADAKTPMAEIEEQSPVIGQSVHLRVYWEKDVPKTGVSTLVTSGAMSQLGSGTLTVPEDPESPEIVDFTEGTASAKYPVRSLDSVRWIGRSAGPVSVEPYTRELRSASDWGVAEIRYTAAYTRYLVHPGQVERLLAVWGFGNESSAAVRVLVCLNSGDASRPADPIEDARITCEAAAVERGTAELDQAAYDRTTISWTAPYEDAARDGATAEIRNENIFVTGNFRISKIETVFEGAAIWQECEGVQCRLPV